MVARRSPKKSVILRWGKCVWELKIFVQEISTGDLLSPSMIDTRVSMASTRRCHRFARITPEILVCRHSSWYRFVSHYIRASSWILQVRKKKKEKSKAFFRADNCECMKLLPDRIPSSEWVIRRLSNPEGDDFGAKNCPTITSGGYLKGAHNASPSATSSSIKTAPQRNTLAWRNNNGPSFVAQTAAARQKASMSFLRFCGRRAVRGRAPRNFEVLRREVRAL